MAALSLSLSLSRLQFMLCYVNIVLVVVHFKSFRYYSALFNFAKKLVVIASSSHTSSPPPLLLLLVYDLSK